MGYAFMFGACFSCGRGFSFNPHKVPSIRDANGERQPVCRECIERANPIREEKGLPPLTYHPDAYEAIREEEL